MSGEGAGEGAGRRDAAGRVRAGLRRHGLVPRPEPIRARVKAPELRFTPGNRVALFHDGRSGLEAMLRALEAARERIHLETYILRTDATGRRFLEALAERARAGVAVRLLYDGFGGLGADPRPLQALRAAGGDVLAFNPLRRFWPRGVRRRDHRKILVVDGRVAFTGGLNVGDEYAGAPGSEGVERTPWRDTHLRLEGPAVREVDAVFLESWFRADGPELSWEELVARAPAPVGDVRCAVLPDGPVYRRRRTRDLVTGYLEAADRHVCLASPYLAPGRGFLAALERAAHRGVSVELFLAGDRVDHPVLRRGARSNLRALLESGVTVHEYARSMLHAKVALFDRRHVLVGTSNLDRQSFRHSYEINVVLEGGDVAERVAGAFERDRAASRSLRLADLDARGAGERMLDRLAGLLVRAV